MNKGIRALDLMNFLESDIDALTLDVREEDERQHGFIEGLHIPLSELELRFQEIPKDRTVVVYCAGGVRSMKAITYLEVHGYDELVNLSDGIYEYLKLV